MISRRSFLLNSFGILLVSDLIPAQAKKAAPKVKAVPVAESSRILSRQDWPPAITPEYVGVVDRGYTCFADDMGRLAVVDLKQDNNPQVIGELFGIGRKVSALAITTHRAYAVVQFDTGADIQYSLVTISLTPANEISVMSKIPLGDFSEPTCVAGAGDLVVVGGSGVNGENQIVVFCTAKKKSLELSQLSAVTVGQTPVKIEILDRQIIVLCGVDNTDLVMISAANPRNIEKQKSLRLDGSFSVLSATRDQIVVAGPGLDKKPVAKAIALRPTLKVIKTLPLPAVSEVLDLAAQKGQFLLLANQGSRQAVIPLVLDKKTGITTGAPVLLPSGNKGGAPRAKIAVKDRDAYIASDWGGMQVLSIQKDSWQFSYSHTIPRLPASAVVARGDKALIVCADLKLYDLKNPQQPVLQDSIDISGNIISFARIDRSVACLGRDSLSLRSIERPSEVLAKIKINGNSLACDGASKRAYVLNALEKKTTVTELDINDTSIQAKDTSEFTVRARRGAVEGDKLLLAGLSEIMLLQKKESLQQIAARQMPNLAIRDLVVQDDIAYLACVNENLRGFLITIDTTKSDLPTIASLDLPIDAAALAVSDKTAVVLGRSPEGKDKVAIVGLSDPMRPKILDSFSVLDAASAVTIKDNMAIVVGRGIEIISLR